MRCSFFGMHSSMVVMNRSYHWVRNLSTSQESRWDMLRGFICRINVSPAVKPDLFCRRSFPFPFPFQETTAFPEWGDHCSNLVSSVKRLCTDELEGPGYNWMNCCPDDYFQHHLRSWKICKFSYAIQWKKLRIYIVPTNSYMTVSSIRTYLALHKDDSDKYELKWR